MMWEVRVKEVEEIYGGFVNWEEAFYICPECGEPVYKCDWNEDELTKFLCPICEDGYFNEDEDDWDVEEDDDDDEFD